MELREYVGACRRRWVWIVVPLLLAAGLAAGLTLTAAPAYRSSMVLFVTTGTGDPDARASRLNSYISLLTGPRVAESVIAKLDLPMTAAEVQRSLSAQVQDGTDLLEVSATDASAERSRQIVTTATTALVGLAKQLDPPPAAGSDGPAPSVSIAQNPVTTRVPGNLVRNVGFSAVLGLLIGAVAVAVREATRRTVGEEDDLRRLGLGAVGVISLGGRSRGGYPDEALAEAFRRLRSLLPDVTGLHDDGGRGSSLLLTGAQPKEGTTAVACGLAIAMAETGASVVLVDANLRTPGIGRYLALDTSRGLADVLAGAAAVPDVLQDSLDGRLTVLPSGEQPPDPGEMLASPRLSATVRALTERFDVVIVDAPPLHGVADAAVLSKVTDGALLVVRANRTRTVDVERSMDLLERVGAKLAGAVLNALPKKLPTGGSWHRGAQVPAAPSDPELVTQLFGADNAAEPESAEPFVTEPFATQPFVTEPFAAEPFVTEPFAAEPVAVGPVDAEPFAAEPVVAEPVAAQPRPGPAKGRAKVVQATVGRPEEVEKPSGDETSRVRGQAKVVVAQLTEAARPKEKAARGLAQQAEKAAQGVAQQAEEAAQGVAQQAKNGPEVKATQPVDRAARPVVEKEPPNLPAQRTPEEPPGE